MAEELMVLAVEHRLLGQYWKLNLFPMGYTAVLGHRRIASSRFCLCFSNGHAWQLFTVGGKDSPAESPHSSLQGMEFEIVEKAEVEWITHLLTFATVQEKLFLGEAMRSPG